MKKILIVFLILLIIIASVSCNTSDNGFNGESSSPSQIGPEINPDSDSIETDHEHSFTVYDWTASESPYNCSICGMQFRHSFLQDCESHTLIQARRSDGTYIDICKYCTYGRYNHSRKDCSESHELTVEIEPTYYNAGIKSVSCSSCGYSKIEVIPPTNEGSYICDMSLQEYADASFERLGEFTLSMFEENVQNDTVGSALFPYDLDSYKTIKDFTLELIKDETTEYGKAQKIYTWIIENIAYNQAGEMYDVGMTFETKSGVCSQYVQLAHDMLSAADIMSYYVSCYSTYVPWSENISVQLPTIFQHAYDTGHSIVACYVDGEVLYMDPTWGRSYGMDNFDMSQEKCASYLIAVEADMLKIIPDNVDIRNYSDPAVKIGQYIMYMSRGVVDDQCGAVIKPINNLSFEFRMGIADEGTTDLILGNKGIAYIQVAYRNAAIFNQGSNLYALPSGRCVSYTDYWYYVTLQSEVYGQSIDLPELYDIYEIYDGCLYQRDQGGYILTTCITEQSEVTVLGKINGIDVSRIGMLAFEGNQTLKKLIIEEGVKDIEQLAFQNCSLEELHLPSTVGRFEGLYTYNLKTIVISEDNPFFNVIDNVVFSEDGSVLVYYPAGKDDTAYTVPDSVKVIYYMCYNDSIENLVLPQSLEAIYSIEELPKVSEINLPSNINYIDRLAGTSIEELILPDGITELCSNAFLNNCSLKRIVLPKNLEKISHSAFVNCEMLEEIVIDGSNGKFKTVDGVLFGDSGKTLLVYPINKSGSSYTVPEGTTKIASNAMALQNHLTEVILPESLCELGEAALNTTNITSIDLKNVEKIGGTCFAGCRYLESIYLSQSVNYVGNQLIYDSGVKYIIIENPAMEAELEMFLRADRTEIFLTYDTVTDKELTWESYVAGIYTQSEWEYVNGIPTVKN